MTDYNPILYKGRARLENIILRDGSSILVNVAGADAVYVVGYMCDVRGFNVSTTLKRIQRSEIKLRIQITDGEREQLARALTFDQKEREFREVL